jgi:hypothetical protein
MKSILPVESPCVDGVLVNLDDRCVSLYWGRQEEVLIKLRCTYAREDSWWANTAFFITPLDYDSLDNPLLDLYCTDKFFNVYTGPTMIRLGGTYEE